MRITQKDYSAGRVLTDTRCSPLDVHMDTLTIKLAAAVKAAIDHAGETVLGVSEKSGIPRTTLLRRLGGTSPFTVAELELIAKVLDIAVSDLLSEAEAVA